MAEWSKATDSSSVLFGGVGSNPIGCTLVMLFFFFIILSYQNKKKYNNNTMVETLGL